MTEELTGVYMIKSSDTDKVEVFKDFDCAVKRFGDLNEMALATMQRKRNLTGCGFKTPYTLHSLSFDDNEESLMRVRSRFGENNQNFQ